MTIRGIKQELLALLFQMGRDAHPHEFVGVLTERGGIIDEVNLLPGTVTGGDSASLLCDMMPLSIHIAGSCHSHPNGVLQPSNADVRFFPRTGRFHIIIGFPYQQDNWRCFTADGRPFRMEVVT
jgi:proteasome lid subunit RPN8/RPN11